MEKTNEGLVAYAEELKRMKKFLLESGSGAELEDEYNIT
jgi:hypothetical protein